MNKLMKNNILFSIIFTACFTPILFFLLGLPMILQIKGFDATIIGLFQILGLPTAIKFLLSFPIDKIRFEKNHYKKWSFFIALIYAFSLVLISFLSFETSNIYLILALLLVSTIISSFLDIPLNALAIKTFQKEQRISASAYKVSSFFLSGLLGGGVLLLIYNSFDWQISFLLMAFMVVSSLFALFFIEEPKEENIKSEKISLYTNISFFKQENISIWIFILMFYFAFISAIWVFLKPYLISKGFDANTVALYVGVYGGILGIIAGLLASKISKKFSKKFLLLSFSLFNLCAILLLIIMENNFIGKGFILLIVSFTTIAVSLSSTIIFSMIMDYSRDSSKAMDYALQFSIYSITRIISAITAGVIVSHLDFEAMFIFESFCVAIVSLVIYKKLHTSKI